MNTTRKLASVKPITYIKPIEGADAIECAIVDGGWPVVVKKGEFQVGDAAIYFEIDSWVPYSIAPFLSKGKEPREYNGVKGEKLRTVRLRGQISQGLLLPLNTPINGGPFNGGYGLCVLGLECGTDLTDVLGVQKWEAPVSAQLAGIARGNFPSFIPKTDQERCQNLRGDIFETHKDEVYEVTVKLDGSSITAYIRDGEVGVCSRNIDLKEDDNNTFWKVVKAQHIDQALTTFHAATGRSIAIQGELIGESIQKNHEKIQGQQLHVFDVFDIDEQKYLGLFARDTVLRALEGFGATIYHVPILERYCIVTNEFDSIDDILEFAEGESITPGVQREGVVFKSLQTTFSFKAISNSYLLKKKE